MSEILREAAALMRERAEAATPGPWRDVPMGSEGSIVLNDGNTISTSRKPATCREYADATHIASWHPAVALAVARLLEVIARDVGTSSLAYKAAESFARAYLGRDA